MANSDTYETAEQCLKDAGAIEICPACRGHNVLTGDGEAERNAYARATGLWKDQARGFRTMEREEVMAVVKSVLDDTPSRCTRDD